MEKDTWLIQGCMGITVWLWIPCTSIAGNLIKASKSNWCFFRPLGLGYWLISGPTRLWGI